MTTEDFEFELIVEKSRTMWLNQDELKKLIEIRDSNISWMSELVGMIIQDQHEKMCGKRVWK